MSKFNCIKFSIEDKERAVKLYLEDGCSYRTIAKGLSISHRLISIWVENYSKYGEIGLESKRKCRALKNNDKVSFSSSEKKFNTLEDEVAFLKELDTLTERGNISNRHLSMIISVKASFDLSILLEIASLPRSSFYYHIKRLGIADKYSALQERIKCIFNDHK